MKVAVNKCFGGFGLSEEAYKELGIERDSYGYEYRDKRTDPELISVIEKLGDKANGQYAQIEIVEIPDGIAWEINEYDGIETIHEVHRSW